MNVLGQVYSIQMKQIHYACSTTVEVGKECIENIHLYDIMAGLTVLVFTKSTECSTQGIRLSPTMFKVYKFAVACFARNNILVAQYRNLNRFHHLIVLE